MLNTLSRFTRLTDMIEYVSLSAISRKLLGGKLAPKLVYFVLRKEL